MYPRLQYVAGDSKFIYNVAQPVTVIGRNGANDLVLSHQTVFGKTCENRLYGGGFEIFDLNSTNKVIVKGQLVKQTALKNGRFLERMKSS
jgi:pSer/pThr/pTyr-binding forkhead associated (FHA) protein